MHLSPSVSCGACCFCFVSWNRSEVIRFLKGRKHLRVLCYVNNKSSCPQALVQVVNKLVNDIEINASGLELKLRSPCIDSVLPIAVWALPDLVWKAATAGLHCKRTPQWRSAFARPEPWPSQGSCPAPRVGLALHPLHQPFSQRLGARDLGQP